MGGGARRRITGPVERLGGARTADEAAMALRFAQALEEQARPLSQIQALYAGIAGEAAKLQSIKALPDSQMLNASARGIKQLETAEDTLNKERQETVTRLKEIDRLEESRARRARKLQERQQYMTGAPAETPAANGGFGGGLRGRAGGAISSALIGGGFPLLFGQGPAAAAGGAIGGLAGGLLGGGFGFALSIVGTAIGDAVTQSQTLNKELNSLNNNLSATGGTSRTTASDISQLASQLGIAKDEAIKLVAAFSEFGSANIRESLAVSFGAVGGEEAFNALAAAIDNKTTLEAIVKLRDTITDSQAKEALKQLEINGAATANAFLQQRLIALQEQKLIKQAQEVRLLDRILAAAAALGAQGQFIDPAIFGQQRVADIKQGATERKNAQNQALQDTRKFLADVARLNEQYSTRTQKGRKPPEDRTAALAADLQAITEIGEAENKIRDLRFQGRDILATEAEFDKQIADITRDRVKALEQANYASEKLKINQIAEARALIATEEKEDKIREIKKQRAEAFAATIRGVQYEIQLTNARISGTEEQAIIEQKVADLKREQKHLTAEDLNQYRDLLRLANERKDAEELANIQRRINATGTGLRAGFIGEAGAAYENQLAAGKSPQRAAEIAQLTTQLTLAQTQARALENSVFAIGEAFGTAMTTGVSALVQGTQSAQQVFAQFLDTIGSALLNAAAQMISTYVAIGIARIFAGMGGGGGGGTDPVANFNLGAAQYGGGLASGGPARAATPYLVGERGPELFVPGTSGGVMSNSDLRASMGSAGGSSNAPVLNMSFETTSIGGVEYVSRDQLEAAMAETRRQATRDGAKRGMSMTLDRIQQSPQTRSRIGIR